MPCPWHRLHGSCRNLCLECLLLAYTLIISALAAFGAHATNDYFIGNSLLNRGALDQAVGHFQKALQIEPDSADTHLGLGNVLYQKGQIDGAIIQLQKAADLQPNYGDTHYHLAQCLSEKGRLDEAIVQCQKAVDLKPGNGVYHNLFGNVLLQKKQFNQAIAEYKKALQINPDNVEANNNLGYAFSMKKQLNEAITQYQEALKYSPKNPSFYFNLGDAFRHKQVPIQAMAAYQKAIDLNPDFVPAEASLAWMLATWPDASVRNGRKAVSLAEDACRFSGSSDPLVLRTLAAAYAETGNFSSAILAAKRGLALAARQSNTNFIRELQGEIGLYETNSPCRTMDY
jgi:tetratricopeptide (TPR) repeat protein